MLRHSFSASIVCLWIAGSASLSLPAAAQTPLKRATISSLRNRVRLLPRSKPARRAKISDVLVPGDGLSTSRASLAELRFNDGTLARMGEHAVFRFVPKTRRFRLSNGTVLLLIPPGQGRTTVKTPNVTAGIRGSGLFLRHDSVTNTTIVGALTNSGIEVMNSDGTQIQKLAAGQMVVAVNREIQGLYDFSLQEFYDTSSLVKGLELDDETPEDESDWAIAKVREETLEGLEGQPNQFDLPSEPGQKPAEILENPGFTALSSASPSSISDFPLRSGGTSSIPLDESSFPGRSIGVNDVPGETTEPAVRPTTIVQPSVSFPPLAFPPVERPPIVEPIAQPPIAEPPIAQPPIETPIPAVGVDDPPVALDPLEPAPEPVLDPQTVADPGQEIVDPNPTFRALFPDDVPVDETPGVVQEPEILLEVPNESPEVPSSIDDSPGLPLDPPGADDDLSTPLDDGSLAPGPDSAPESPIDNGPPENVGADNVPVNPFDITIDVVDGMENPSTGPLIDGPANVTPNR